MTSSTLTPDAEMLLAQLADIDSPPMREMSVAACRAAASAMFTTLDLPPDPTVNARAASCEGDEGHQIPLRCYSSAQGGRPGPVLVYFHGGGWITGDLDSHDSFCRYLCSASGLRVIAVDYRRPPEFPFPAAYCDGLAVARSVLAGEGPLDGSDGVVVAGDSAGGGIAAAIAQELKLQDHAVVAQLLLYPVLDLVNRATSYRTFAEGFLLEAADMEYFISSYVPNAADRSDPRCSPLLAPSMEQLPPLVLLTAGHDPLRDEGRSYAASCICAGVDVRFHEAGAYLHGIATMREKIPSSRGVLSEVIRSLKAIIR